MALLKQFKTDFGVIRITRSKRDGSTSYYQNGCFHSQANKYGVSVCVYVHVIQDIIRQARARRVLVIGCAGGTLATMLRRQHCKVTAVDINPLAFVIARDYFCLPHDVRCVLRDGIAYLRTTRRTYDAVVVDVFGSDNTVPPIFTNAAFFEKVARVLSPSGVMIMNVITAHDGDHRADIIAHQARRSGMMIAMVDWPGELYRNTLLIGGAQQKWRVPSGREANWIKPDLEGVVIRRPQKYRWS